MLEHYRAIPKLLNEAVPALNRCNGSADNAAECLVGPTGIGDLGNLIAIVTIPSTESVL
jgi:hypothetical protein